MAAPLAEHPACVPQCEVTTATWAAEGAAELRADRRPSQGQLRLWSQVLRHGHPEGLTRWPQPQQGLDGREALPFPGYWLVLILQKLNVQGTEPTVSAHPAGPQAQSESPSVGLKGGELAVCSVLCCSLLEAVGGSGSCLVMEQLCNFHLGNDGSEDVVSGSPPKSLKPSID